MEILRAEHLTKIYGKGNTSVTAVNDLSLSVAQGEFVAVVGSSGSGKSTLLHMLGGVDQPTEGKVWIQGEDIYTLSTEKLAIFRRRQIGLIYQFFNLIPTLNVEENITLPCELDGQTVDKKRLDKLIEYAKDLSGDYDYVFYDVPREEADHIVNNRKVATAYQSVGLGYAKLSGSKNPDKPYVYLTAMDNRAMQKNALHLIKGRMPKNDHEILLSRHMMTNGGVEYRVGDTITLDISEREDKNGNVLTQSSGYRTGEKLKKKLTASFQVVGIVQRPNFGFEEWTAPGYSVITYLNPKGDNIPEKYMQRTDIYCKYTKAGLRDRAQTTADIVGVTLTPGVQKFPFIKDERITNRQINDLMERSPYRFYENWGLIRFERMDIGQSAYHMLYLAVAVTNVIILAAAVSCIGSSFAISMEEKRKSYGMLASVGATPRQIRQSVYYEAFLTGRTAIPLGTVLGLLLSTGGIFAIKALLYGQNTVQYLHVHVAWQMLIAGILLSTVTLVLSARRPARQAAKSSPVAAMRGQAKKSRRAKKRTITAAIAGCTALFILVSYFMGVQTISVGQSNHMFDDHANVSVDVQGSWEVNRSAVLQSTKEKKRHGSGSPADGGIYGEYERGAVYTDAYPTKWSTGSQT